MSRTPHYRVLQWPSINKMSCRSGMTRGRRRNRGARWVWDTVPLRAAINRNHIHAGDGSESGGASFPVACSRSSVSVAIVFSPKTPSWPINSPVIDGRQSGVSCNAAHKFLVKLRKPPNTFEMNRTLTGVWTLQCPRTANDDVPPLFSASEAQSFQRGPTTASGRA